VLSEMIRTRGGSLFGTCSSRFATRPMPYRPPAEFGRVGVEGHQPPENPVVHRQLDDRAPRNDPTQDVAVLEQVMQQRAGLDVLGKRQGNDCHDSRSDFWCRPRISTSALVIRRS
jgi:hypothetical protein